MRFLLIWVLCLGMGGAVSAQKEFHAACIAFYNFENLFDTLDSPDTDDLEFTPGGSNVYTSKVYWEKLANLAQVVSEIGTNYTPDGAAILGVAEIENREVLEDFVRQPAIASRGYRIIHQESQDPRGVDVALLYNPKYFRPEQEIFIPLQIGMDSVPIYSRDILVVIGELLGERVLITVNHWPSRRGGEQKTQPLRNLAAEINRGIIDSMGVCVGGIKSIVMGDLNDDPVNESVRKYLRGKRNIDKLKEGDMYNPFEDFYHRGIGSNAYQDAWSLFDQIILSRDLALDREGLYFHKAGIFNPPYLKQRSGPFKGYPYRTYANGVYAGGYSDHFPVYVILVKEKS